MKNLKKVLALVLAVVMIMGTVAVASAKEYTDVAADNKFAEAIDVLSNLNILDGFKDGEKYKFQPDGYFTRAQAAKIVAIVHNAATNGEIKGQDAISALYSNAQNSFVDCNNSWALPYINYCRITGLLDGMTKTTYAPERLLTGVQWLKLMLTTLNFDTNKEGYVGTGWDVNVLNRANEVGLLKGLPEGWKGINNVTRGEAAQILYNALTKYLVEYGQVIKNGNDLDKAFVANEGVNKSGFTLAAKMGISITRTTDAYRRPGYTWASGSWSKFYMDKPKAEYKTAVTECEVLKVMGIAENSDKKVTLNGVIDGKAVNKDGSNKIGKLIGKDADLEKSSTALNYYAVDGFKYTVSTTGPENCLELQHDDQKICQTAQGSSWKAPIFGGQGDLTQVFQTEDGWVVTVIHTFLGEVTEVNKNNKYSHATAEGSKLTLFIEESSPVAGGEYADTVADLVIKENTKTTKTAYAVGEKVLATVSFKKSEAANKVSGPQSLADITLDYRDSALASVDAAESKTGKLTGASGMNQAETVSIDGTKYPTNCRFVLGKDSAMNIASNGKVFTFYFDSYGNVIGRVANTDTKSYVVMDEIWAHADDGKFTVYAKLYDLTGAVVGEGKVKVSTKAGAFKGFFAKRYEYNYEANEAGVIATLSEHSDPQLTDALYTYTVDDKGVYTLELAGKCFGDCMLGANSEWFEGDAAYGRYATGLAHAAKTAFLTIYREGQPEKTLNLTEATKFVVKHGTKWTSYTGYTALPAMYAQYIDFELDTDGYASIVYIGEANYEGDNFTGFVPTWKAFEWVNVDGIAYAQVKVYVNGELKTVNVKPSATFTMWDEVQGNYVAKDYDLRDGHEPATGMYKFYTELDKNDNTFVSFAFEESYLLAQGHAQVSSTSNDVTAFTVGTDDRAFNVTGTTIYLVKADGTIETVDSSYINGAFVMVYGDKDNTRVAVTIYAFDKNAFNEAGQPRV